MENIPKHKFEDDILEYLLTTIWDELPIDIHRIVHIPRVVIDTWFKYKNEFILYSNMLSHTENILPIIILEPRSFKTKDSVKVLADTIRFVSNFDIPLMIQAKFSDINKVINILPKKYLNQLINIIKKHNLIYAPIVPFAYEQASINYMEVIKDVTPLIFNSSAEDWRNILKQKASSSGEKAEVVDKHFVLLHNFYKITQPHMRKIIKEIEKIQRKIGLQVPGESTFNSIPRHLYRAFSALLYNYHKYGHSIYSEIMAKDFRHITDMVSNIKKTLCDIAHIVVSIRIWEYTGITFDRYEVLSTCKEPIIALSNVPVLKLNREMLCKMMRYLPKAYLGRMNFIGNFLEEKYKIIIPSYRLLRHLSIEDYRKLFSNRYINYHLQSIAEILDKIKNKDISPSLLRDLNEENARLAEEIYRYVYKVTVLDQHLKHNKIIFRKVISGMIKTIVPLPPIGDFLEAIQLFRKKKSTSTQFSLLKVIPNDIYVDREKGVRYLAK